MAKSPDPPARRQLIKRLWKWLAQKDKQLNDLFLRNYPQAAAKLDNAFVFIVEKVLSHPLFAVVLSIILTVLAFLDGDKLILILILAAWAITALWVARSKTVKKLTILSRLAVLSVATVLFGAWAISEYQATTDFKNARNHLQVSRNYQSDRNAPKALEYALKAYQADKDSPEIVSNLAYAHLAMNEKQSFLKAREILVANSHRLDLTGKATLGMAEYKLNNYGAAFSVLGALNLNECNEDMLPFAVIALTGSALETLPYKEALLKMRDGLLVLDRRIALYDLRASVSGDKANLSVNFYRWHRLRAAKFDVGGLWLAKAQNQKDTRDMIEAIKMAGEGMIIIFQLIPVQNIIRYLAWINELTDDSELIKSSPNFVLETLDGYKKILAGGKNKYAVELIKLELLRNCLLDVYSARQDKRSIDLTLPVEFTIERLVTSDVDIRRIMISKNFAIRNPHPLLEDKLPTKKLPIKETVKLASNDFFDRTESFAFELNVQVSSGHEIKKTFCPNFFANQVNP